MARFVPEEHEVKALREKYGIGLAEAKRELIVEKLSFELSALRAGTLTDNEYTLTQIIDVILELV